MVERCGELAWWESAAHSRGLQVHFPWPQGERCSCFIGAFSPRNKSRKWMEVSLGELHSQLQGFFGHARG